MCAWVCDWRSNNYWSEQKSNAIIPSNLSLKSVLTGRPRIRNRQKSKKSHKLTRESIIGFYHPYCLTTAIHTTPRETKLWKLRPAERLLIRTYRKTNYSSGREKSNYLCPPVGATPRAVKIETEPPLLFCLKYSRAPGARQKRKEKTVCQKISEFAQWDVDNSSFRFYFSILREEKSRQKTQIIYKRIKYTRENTMKIYWETSYLVYIVLKGKSLRQRKSWGGIIILVNEIAELL